MVDECGLCKQKMHVIKTACKGQGKVMNFVIRVILKAVLSIKMKHFSLKCVRVKTFKRALSCSC